MKRFLSSCAAALASLCGAWPAAAAGQAPEVVLDQQAPVYAARVHSRKGEALLRVRVHPEVRSVSFRFHAVPPASPQENRLTEVEVLEAPRTPGAVPRALVRGRVRQTPDPQQKPEQKPEPQQEPVWRLLRSQVRLTTRDADLFWLIRLRNVPEKPGLDPEPLELSVRIEADARPVTDRERALMAWRAGIDPLKQPDAVRAKIAELTDEEVRHYTGFKDRASFLKHWMKTRLSDLRDEAGETTVNEETLGLFARGNPLPNGQYLHHHGRPEPLPP